MRITTLLSLLLLSSAALPAQDIKPFDIKLGLWETSTTTEMSGMPAMPAMPQIPPETLARMPPEQRARMEAMMKARSGGKPMAVKSCITRETLNRSVAFSQQDKSCTTKVVSSTPSKQVVHMECTRENTHMTGDMTVERTDAEHAKGTSVMKMEGDHPTTMKMSFETKWLSADCGDVKPPALPK